jgi:hypothetical protein
LPAKRFTLVLLGGIGATLAVYTVLGGALLSEASDSLVGSAEAIAAGADQRTEVTHTTLVPHPAGRPDAVGTRSTAAIPMPNHRAVVGGRVKSTFAPGKPARDRGPCAETLLFDYRACGFI